MTAHPNLTRSVSSLEPYYDDGQITLFCADNRDLFPSLLAVDADYDRYVDLVRSFRS